MSRPVGDELERKLRETMKKELRRSMATTRAVLPRDARTARDASVASRLASLPEVATARVIAGYVAARGECDPAATLEAALGRGAIVALPTVDLAAQRIVWKRRTLESPLEYGAFGILEPGRDAEEIDPGSIEVVLVPGAAFDATGGRLGLGKGFYDRALPEMPAALRIGIGFDFQFVAELPLEPHDVPMRLVVTDARTVDLR